MSRYITFNRMEVDSMSLSVLEIINYMIQQLQNAPVDKL